MTELSQPPGRFRVIATGALGDAHRRTALAAATGRLRDGRLEAWEELDGWRSFASRATRRACA